jgi:hypothetical protein
MSDVDTGEPIDIHREHKVDIARSGMEPAQK